MKKPASHANTKNMTPSSESMPQFNPSASRSLVLAPKQVAHAWAAGAASTMHAAKTPHNPFKNRARLEPEARPDTNISFVFILS